ncbi:hypothetical protein M885DRAFT_614126 [Pelagophyceae sp. CCMP2097]|nr:hypothetical protein M885DRAFT_614126 [Pelagophyceae sp. CCMP2097]
MSCDAVDDELGFCASDAPAPLLALCTRAVAGLFQGHAFDLGLEMLPLELREALLMHRPTCAALTDDVVQEIAGHCTNLQTFWTSAEAPLLGDGAVHALAQRHETLTALSLEGARLSQDGAASLGLCGNLHRLGLAGCRIAGLGLSPAAFPALTDLDVGMVLDVSWCPNVDGAVVSAILQRRVMGVSAVTVLEKCTRLRHFNVSGCRGITGNVLSSLGDARLAQRLDFLDCSWVDACHAAAVRKLSRARQTEIVNYYGDVYKDGVCKSS